MTKKYATWCKRRHKKHDARRLTYDPFFQFAQIGTQQNMLEPYLIVASIKNENEEASGVKFYH